MQSSYMLSLSGRFNFLWEVLESFRVLLNKHTHLYDYVLNRLICIWILQRVMTYNKSRAINWKKKKKT